MLSDLCGGSLGAETFYMRNKQLCEKLRWMTNQKKMVNYVRHPPLIPFPQQVRESGSKVIILFH